MKTQAERPPHPMDQAPAGICWRSRAEAGSRGAGDVELDDEVVEVAVAAAVAKTTLAARNGAQILIKANSARLTSLSGSPSRSFSSK